MKIAVAIIGGGPAAMMLAASLDASLFKVTIYEKNKTLGRKFLVAGKGGFNLTHSEDKDTFLQRYTLPAFLQPAFNIFDNADLQAWLKAIGIPTYTGSSKRIFPIQGIKPIEVLNSILEVLKAKQVSIKTGYEWNGWNDDGNLTFVSKPAVKANYHVFALGGGSWKVTGSDGSWLERFKAKGISTFPFYPANCAYQINWPAEFLQRVEGKALKNIAITCAQQTQKGEAVITTFGLEGNAIYGLSPSINTQLKAQGQATIFIDLKPQFSKDEILSRLQNSKYKNITEFLKTHLKLSSTQIDLLKYFLTKEEYTNQQLLTEKIKNLPLKILSPAPIDEAISTTGGIDLNAVNQHYELNTLSKTFCIGEMLDWNAPTGGYLLQACFSMGVYLGRYLNDQG